MKTFDKRRVIFDAHGNVVRNLDAPSLEARSVWGGYEGAMTTPEQKWAYVPRMSSQSVASEELDRLSRTVLLDRISHLYRNNGKPRRIINCITRMVTGTGLIPEPMTRDTRYNDNVRKLWLRDAESPRSFSLNKKFSSSSAQRALKRAQLKTGDSCMIPAKDADGRLRFMLYDGAQIGDGVGRPYNMRDGVLLDEHQTALSYRILGRDLKNVPTQVDIPSENVLFFASLEGTGWNRGVTCLAHAVKNLRSINEIDDAYTMGIKAAAQYAWTIESQPGTAPNPAGSLGPGGAPSRPQVVVEDPVTKKPMVLEKILQSGQIEELAPGKTLKIVHDERPHPNVKDHETELIRDIAQGTDYPYDILWRVDALGGANTRYVLADCQSKIAIDQEEMCEQILCPMYILKLQDWEAAGELPPCEDPEWWMHEWLTPARMTVDFGRDGRIYIEQWKQGHITLKTLYGFTGDGWKRQTTQWLEEIAWKKAEMQRLKLVREDLPISNSTISFQPDQATPPSKGPKASNYDLEIDDDL